MIYDLQRFEKQSSESRNFVLDFADKMADGQTVSGITSVVCAGLTVGATSASGTKVTMRLSAGTTGNTYKGTAIVTTSGGDTLEKDFNVQVLDL